MTGIVRALGKTVGFFGRMSLPRPRLPSREKKPRAERADLVPSQPADHEGLQVEIDRMERELDSVYAQVVKGAGAVSRNGVAAGGPDLADLLERSRELKERLGERRAEMARLERDRAREKRLSRNVSLEADLREQRRRPTAQPEQQAPEGRGKRAMADPHKRKALDKAARNVSLGDGSQQVIFEKALQDLLEDDAEIRRAAVVRLGELRDRSLVGVLAEVLEDRNNNVVTAALNALALLGSDACEPLFGRFASSPDHHLRLASLRGLAKVETESAGRSILNALGDENAQVRKGAATYLGWRRERAAVRGLMQTLHDENEQVRAAAAGALGLIRDERAVLSLIRSIGDPELGVREAAKNALESVLETPVDIDIDIDIDPFDARLEELKDWWKKARIDRHVTGEVQLPDLGGIKASRPRPPPPEPPEPAAPSEPAPPPPVVDSDKVVDFRASAAARAARVIKLAQRPEERDAERTAAEARETAEARRARESAAQPPPRVEDESEEMARPSEASPRLQPGSAPASEPPVQDEQEQAVEQTRPSDVVASAPPPPEQERESEPPEEAEETQAEGAAESEPVEEARESEPAEEARESEPAEEARESEAPDELAGLGARAATMSEPPIEVGEPIEAAEAMDGLGVKAATMSEPPIELGEPIEAGDALAGLGVTTASDPEPADGLDDGEAPDELAGLGAVASSSDDAEPAAGLDDGGAPDELAGLGAVAASSDDAEPAGSLLDEAGLDGEAAGLGDLDIKIGGGDDAIGDLGLGEADSEGGGLDNEEEGAYESLLGEDFPISDAKEESGPNSGSGDKKKG